MGDSDGAAVTPEQAGVGHGLLPIVAVEDGGVGTPGTGSARARDGLPAALWRVRLRHIPTMVRLLAGVPSFTMYGSNNLWALCRATHGGAPVFQDTQFPAWQIFLGAGRFWVNNGGGRDFEHSRRRIACVGDPYVVPFPPTHAGWQWCTGLEKTTRSVTYLPAFVDSVEELVVPWSVARHRRMRPAAREWVLTAILCAKRLETAAARGPSAPGGRSLPRELWLCVLECVAQIDMLAASGGRDEAAAGRSGTLAAEGVCGGGGGSGDTPVRRHRLVVKTPSGARTRSSGDA